ncbi:energy-coupling factor ABC transporter permease [Deltaproteobacteria bacterium TL4]
MHISEGIITGLPAAAYTLVGLGLVGYGAKKMKALANEHPEKKPLLGMMGAFIFFLSLLPIPAFTGTTSHPCGSPLAGILLGPGIAIALSGLSLLLQAAFFAHGGLSTWGANVVTLGVGGAFFGWFSFWLARKAGLSLFVSGAIGGLVGDIMTYVMAGLSLSTVLATGPNPQYSWGGYLTVIYAAYIPTQGPIALGEMFLTGLILNYIYKQRPSILVELKVITATVAAVLMFLCVLPPSLSAVESEIPTFQETSAPSVQITGMDQVVNESLADRAGLPPREPYLNIEAMGDLWNTVLLLGGGICGFIIGRYWNHLFGKEDERTV